MNSQPGQKPVCPSMLVIVTHIEEQKKLGDALEVLEIPISYQCRGKGTASSEMMDIFGLQGTARLVTISFLPKPMVKPVLERLDQRLSFHKRGGGIAITIPLTGMQNPVLQILNESAHCAASQETEGAAQQMKNHTDYTVIWASVGAGYSDDVVSAARTAGARGGTVMRGRRQSSEPASRHFGISMQEEQDFVMIIAPHEKKSEIMTAICNCCGLKTPAHGVVISLPVDEAMGLEG